MKISFVIIFSLISFFSWSCSAPQKGFLIKTQDELILKTDNIVLAKFTGQTFVAVEVLKSSNNSTITNKLNRFYKMVARVSKRNKNSHVSNDFDAHNKSDFWQRKTARIGWSAGSCTPSFTFKVNESYLLFLDSPANPYSAEIIKSSNDKWYTYVLGKVKT